MLKLFKQNLKTRIIIKKSNLFNQKYYLTNNPKVKHYRGDPLEHYILHGEKEGRKPNTLFDPKWYKNNNKIELSTQSLLAHYIQEGEKEGNRPSFNFDPMWYLEKNTDLQNTFWKNKPLLHFLKIGLNENRFPSKETQKKIETTSLNVRQFFEEYGFSHNEIDENLNDRVIFNDDLPKSSAQHLKLAIVIHAYYLNIVPEILTYLNKIPFDFSSFFTTNIENEKKLKTLLDNSNLTNFTIRVTKNEGYDIKPFLDILPDLKKKEYDLVCKIHTKKGAANLENHLKGIDNLWFKLLIDPLLGSERTIHNIINAFYETPSMGMVGSADMYKSAQKLMYDNETHVARALQTLDQNFDPAQNWGFFAGTMFWARLNALEPLINNHELNSLLEEQSKMKTGQVASIYHSIERIFGALPHLTGKKTALSFATDIKRTKHAILTINKHYAPSPLGVGMTLQNEFEVNENYLLLENNKDFDMDFYKRNKPLCKIFKIDPILDFIRYGVYQNLQPNSFFSPFIYWSLFPETLTQRKNPLIHSIQHNNSNPLTEMDDSKAINVIKKSKLFSPNAYFKENHDVKKNKIKASTHYCKHGWQEERTIGSTFDTLWYTSNYLSNFLAPVNPLLHYLLIGKKMGLLPRPILKDTSLNKFKPLINPKRICLFAAYDPDGIIDNCVIHFIKELSNFSDVYFLSDCNLVKGELDKIKAHTKGAWNLRHGEYDFGSYKRLAEYYVGWDTIKQYDELLLVNDSSYLIKPLKETFSKMDNKSCSWWGMQATKGISATKNNPTNTFKTKIPISEIKENKLQAYEKDVTYDFLVGSYFLAFRKPILDGGELRDILNSVKKERSKKNIILKYEVGVTRKLILSGYEFDTAIDHLYPFHPVYTNQVFDLIKHGYPLFKRFFLTENHYQVQDLWQWKEKLLDLIPELNINPLEENLLRIADAGKLQNNLNITSKSKKILNNSKFIKQDNLTQVDMKTWAFPVCAYNHTFSGNERGVFEEVKNNPDIIKIILYRTKKINVSGKNVIIAPLQSYQGQIHLMNSGVIFIKNNPRDNAIYPLNPKKHKLINLWHGIPLKRIGIASLDFKNKTSTISAVHSKFHSVISSSKIDRLAMTAAFSPLTYNDIWVTGLPRNDFILKDKNLLPEDFLKELTGLKSTLNNNMFILFVPTFRNAQEKAYYHFSQSEKKSLNEYLETNNIILGVREHMADKANSYSDNLLGGNIIDVGSKLFPNIEILYRKADLLITDYSSCFIDFMLTGKPMISFAYDYEHYMNKERGFFYDMDFVFPGPICKDFQTLLSSIKKVMSRTDNTPSENYLFKRKIFFDFVDDKNSSRVVKEIDKIPID